MTPDDLKGKNLIFKIFSNHFPNFLLCIIISKWGQEHLHASSPFSFPPDLFIYSWHITATKKWELCGLTETLATSIVAISLSYISMKSTWCMWWPKNIRAKTKEGLGMKERKTRPLSSFPSPCCNYWWIPGPPEQYNLSPLLPQKEKVFALIFPLPRICASSNQQMTSKTPIPLLVPWV